jgi:hypothetical protein
LKVSILVCGISILGLVLGCGGGGSSSNKVTQPSNLVYPQTTITATVGTAIAADTPTVMGSTATFSNSPVLPAGLALSSSTGAISGMPTAVTAQAAYTVTATNSAGSTSATLQITVNPAPPSNLTYPQTTVMATVGTAIAPDTPTVTGTVTGYTVSPTLPAGLSIDGTTGTISGTPTVVTAQATYTVTASNSVGSTTATLQIAVNPPPPANLVYPQTTLSAFVGAAITADIPVVTGTVTEYTVSPALPEGLALDSATGAISGTPTAITTQAAYTVTASNAGGSTSAIVAIAVNKALNSLLELGHAAPIFLMRSSSTRVFSEDYSGHWALFDYASGTELAKGDAWYHIDVQRPADMAGPTIAVGIDHGVEVRSSSDGHLLATIASPMIDPPLAYPITTWWKLASDGSYICAGSTEGLNVWSPTGQLLISRSGDYSAVNGDYFAKNVFAAPGEVRVALGPAGQNVVETISTADGTSTVGPAFSGQFNSWFLDGEHFLTNVGTTVWAYSNTSSQVGSVVSLPSVGNLTGQGNWVWTDDYNGLEIYPIGSATPAASYYVGNGTASGTTIGVFNGYGNGYGISIIDLSGQTPSETNYALPQASYNNLPPGSVIKPPNSYTLYMAAYTATSSSQWLVGFPTGVVFDGATAQVQTGTDDAAIPAAPTRHRFDKAGAARQPIRRFDAGATTQPRYLTQGAAWSIAGGSDRTAIATSLGTILYFDPAVATPQGSINYPSLKLALSSDGTTLAAEADTYIQLNIYSLPGDTPIYTWPNPQYLDLTDFTMSGSGTTLGQVLCGIVNSQAVDIAQVTPTTGGPTIWSYSAPFITTLCSIEAGSLRLSPDGTLIAFSNLVSDPTSSTNIYKNGTLVGAVPGWVIGWIDNNQLLVAGYSPNNGAQFTVFTVYSATGAKLATPALPPLTSMLPVTSDSIYSPDLNAIYSVTTGAATWTSAYPTVGLGAVAGSYIVFQSGSEILVDNYTQ